jgi:F-type H+-transporting ATPase subunit gamma
MSDSIATLRHKITGASDLHAVVRTMKALAASSIGDYERSVLALAGYDRMVSLGLGECFRQASAATTEAAHMQATADPPKKASADEPIGAIVFGSDQGLVGPFNDVIAEFAIEALAAMRGRPRVWAVGERVQARLKDAGLDVPVVYALPGSVQAIAPLVAQIQIDSEASRTKTGMTQVHVFHNRPLEASLYQPVSQRLLPLDASWERSLAAIAWPDKMRPQVLDHDAATMHALIREYLFITLYRACAESLASENASRLAAMERADRNIKDLLDDLHSNFHRLRQSSIDEELFDVTAGYEALTRL